MSNQSVDGRVTEERKNYFIVSTDSGEYRCTVKGTLKKQKTKVCTGDLVVVQVINSDSHEGIISDVRKRISFLPRPPLANLSQVIFINTFKSPNMDLQAIDRFLFTAMVYHVKAVIVFNKTDLLSTEDIQDLTTIEQYYAKIGYKTLHTSASNKTGIAELVDLCKGKTSAFTGLSGVGKSSLLSLIFPQIDFRTNEVSGGSGRGTHTTTHTTLHAMDQDSFIADTPGFAFVDVPTVKEEDVACYFPEIEGIIGKCRFNNCIHDQEPGCIVNEMVQNETIAAWRYDNYMRLYKEMKTRRKNY